MYYVQQLRAEQLSSHLEHFSSREMEHQQHLLMHASTRPFSSENEISHNKLLHSLVHFSMHFMQFITLLFKICNLSFFLAD